MIDADILALKKFYNVESDRDLIEAMEGHIERLQLKVRQLAPTMKSHQIVREG